MYAEFKEGQKHGGYDPATTTDDNLSAFKDAGYVLTPHDLVVDIDELPPDKIKQMLKWFDIQTEVVFTKRGAHLYFNRPTGFRAAKAMTDLGFMAEYKHTNNTFATTVKRNGVARPVINHGMRADLPPFLKPDRKAKSLLGLADGEGRNQALFSQRAKVQRYENWRQILEFINKVVFDEPLPDNEMEEITRDMKPQAVKDGEAIIADAVAHDLKVVNYGGMLWYRANGDWYKADDTGLKRIIYEYAPNEKTFYIEEVFKQLQIKTPPIDGNTVFDIRLNNGILRKGKFIDIQSDEFTPFSIDLDYDPNATAVPIVDTYLNNLTGNEPQYREMIEEILGYTLFTDKELIRLIGKFFFFVGDGGNGKGTLLEIIRQILGKENVSTLAIDQMVDERYLNSMVGKLANLGDDVEDKPIDDKKMKVLKNISTADNVSIRRLYENASTDTLSATLIFTTNHILKSFEKGESYKRRVLWCPMYGKPKHKSKTFISDVTTPEALTYWIKLIVDGYQRLYNNLTFTESPRVKQFNDTYHEENNSVLEYLSVTDAEHFAGMTSPEAYEEYEVWAEENDYNTQSKRLFRETLKAELGYDLKQTKINKVNKRVFIKDDGAEAVTKNGR
ncbi:phage/plasmid primase, P4 family [Lacticaseibacillus pabuli]|uniref:Phage/plasmid primase, P4 family n=1 Tax=Lacticaseibacillus pabuli TaxID=3025672 RepID=A0ABY7WR67_9LACO|nr:phage/plasmid primase, P4 family [Lacticaseibacillus sp. KACC 23028]WDF81848.1 phage/plasmid primase, P4 family [Lacticaseibacillus sp. KACC 23028]